MEATAIKPPYFTEIQLLTGYLLELMEKYEQSIPDSKLRVESLQMPTEEIFLLHLVGSQGKLQLKILQMLNILKLYVQLDTHSKPHVIWFHRKSFVKPSLTNTLSRKLIINEQRLQAVLVSRVLSKLHKQLTLKSTLLETVLGQVLQAVTLLKYLTVKDIRNLHLTCTTIYVDCNSKPVYKALYQTRFGRTGFGLELEWKTLFFNKTDRNFI